MPQSPEQPQPWANNPQQAAQIASSNQTANRFLGGLPRPWMNDDMPGDSLVRPSNITPRKRNRSLEDSNVDENGSRHRASFPTNGTLGQINTSDNTINQPVLPSPALTDEPSPVISTQTNSPSNAGSGNVALSQPITASRQLPGGGTSPTPAIVSISRSPTETFQGPNDARVNQRLNSQMREQAMASASGMTGLRPPPSMGENTSPTVVSYGTYVPTPTSREQSQNSPRVQQQNSKEPNPRLETVLARIAQCHNERSVNASDISRYRMLREACEKKDLYYVALHQVLCRWSLDRSGIYSALSQFLQPNEIDHGLENVQKYLNSNGALSLRHIQWFANFPGRELEICRLQQNLAPWVGSFLKQMCVCWETMLQRVVDRRYPLLIIEMNQNLNCYSTTLQPILFATSYKVLGVFDVNWGRILNDNFAQDQKRELKISGNIPPLPTEEIDMLRAATINQYRHIISRVHQQRPSNTEPPSHLAQHYRSMAQGSSRHENAQQQHTTPNTHANSSAMAAAPPQSRALPQTQIVPSNTQVPVPSQSRDLPQTHFVPSNTQVSVPPQSRAPPQTHFVPSNAPVYHQLPQARQHQQRNLAPNPQTQGLQYPPHMQNMPNIPTAQVMTPTPSFGAVATPQVAQEQGATRGYVPQAIPPSQPGLPQYQTVPPQYQAHRGNPNGAWGSLHRYQIHPDLRTAVTEISPAEYPSSLDSPRCLQVGLHMVRVRSPKRVPAQSVHARFYQYTKDLLVGPHPLTPQATLQKVKFDVSAANMAKLTTKKLSPGLPTYRYDEGSYRYRLRICMQSRGKAEFTKSDWAVSACCWPKHIFITLNDKHLSLSRKQHFHKDLPLELTDGVMEGSNVISISFPDVRENQKNGCQHFIGVELVQTNSHNLLKAVITGANSNGTSADEMKKKFKSRLTPLDSDELVIVDDALKISLTDPFSARMLEIPVRGVDCQHFECFDLENWLRTRPRKQTEMGKVMIEEESEPSLVDGWKCPICDGDARPNCLVVDGFLVQVRNDLIAKGETNVRAIKVTADGQWKVVEEPDEKENTPTPSTSNFPNGDGRRPKATSPVVIELD